MESVHLLPVRVPRAGPRAESVSTEAAGPSPLLAPGERALPFPGAGDPVWGTWRQFFSSGPFPVGSATGERKSPDVKSPLVWGERARKKPGQYCVRLIKAHFLITVSPPNGSSRQLLHQPRYSRPAPSAARRWRRRTCRRWAEGKHTCWFGTHLPSLLRALPGGCCRLPWPVTGAEDGPGAPCPPRGGGRGTRGGMALAAGSLPPPRL